MHKYISVISFILLVLAWLYPFHYAPWFVAENEFFILMLPCVWSFTLLKYRKIKTNELLIFPLVLLFFSFIQYLIIEYYFLEDFVLVSIYSLFILLTLTISQLYKKKEHIYLFLKIIIFLCLINSIIVLCQYFDIRSIFILEHSSAHRFYANIGQPNHLSTLFSVGVISSVLLYKHKIIKIKTLYITSIYLTFFIFLTGSRTGILTLFCMMFLGLIFRKTKNIKFNFQFFGFLSLTYLIFTYFFANNSRNNVKSLNAALNDSRLTLWSDSISSILANPWIGYGINGVRTSRLFSDLNFKIPYISSHNIFLDFFLWFGIVGGLFFCFYLLIIFIKIIEDTDRGYEILLFLTPFIIHSLFEYPFRYLYLLILIIPAFSLIKNLKIFYISRFLFLSIILVYVALIAVLYIEFNNHSRGAFFAKSQKCETREKLAEPILMNLMYGYSRIYCNTLTEQEIKRVIYRYAYPIHVQYYIEQGFYDGNLNRMYQINLNEKK